MRGATGDPIQPHQIVRLPRKMTRLLNPRHTWNVIYNAGSNRCHDPTSPNTAPVRKNDTAKFQSNCPKTGETSFPMRGRSEHDPTMIRPWSENETVSPQPASQPRLLFKLTTTIFYWKIQRFAPNLTFKHSPSAVPATKSDTWTSPSTAPATKSDTSTSPSIAPATKSDTWTSPSTAPATQWHLNFTKYLELHQVLHLPGKVPLEICEVLHLPRKVILDLQQIARLPRKVTLELHQILRLSRRKAHMINPHHIWNLVYNKRSKMALSFPSIGANISVVFCLVQNG